MKKMIVLVVCILILASAPSTFTANGPDLTVTNLAVVTDLNTQTTTVTATIKNIGNASTITPSSPTGRFDILVRVSSAGIGQGSQSASNTIRRGPLAAGASTAVLQVFMGTNWKNANVKADVNLEIPETNESNNCMSTCNWAYIIDFHDLFATPVDVGNIALYPAGVELVIQEISPGLTVTFSPSSVYLDVDEVTTVMMNVVFAPGFTEGYVVVVGIYDDGYTESPARIEFIDTNP